MSLGVLNNLNAIYAANNLNNTSASLSTVLQQLSSGSKINSGADDAAGLSLVNGLQANSMALAQSQTNAAEGVGLLKVADGALSQVTNLLNRAVTLATEASNGTLNSSQDAAANSEYQSILSEINNIGTTTTYNGQTVFGKDTSIYTGDSSTVGSSIDELHIGTLSSSNVGNSGGVMSYSSGQSSVFLNMSGATNAQATDTLNTSGTTTINVNYLVKGGNNTSSPASTAITVGGTSGYANTVNGLIGAINNAGLGLTANFNTQAQAGVAGGGTQTGIQISGGLISVGSDPSSVTTGGTLTMSGASASSILAPNQTVSIQSGSAAAIAINIDPTIKTLGDLAAKINTQSAANAGNSSFTQVVATVVTNADSTQSLSLVDANPTGGKLTVTDTAFTYTPAITVNTAVTGSAVNLDFTATQTGTAGGGGVAAGIATATLDVAGIGTNSATAALTGSMTLSNNGASVTVTMGSNAANDATHIYLSTANSTLTGLMSALNGNSAAATALGLSAALTPGGGLTMTSLTGGTTIAGSAAGLTATPAVAMQSNVAGAVADAGSVGTTVISMVNGPGLAGADTLASGSTIVVTNSSLNNPGAAITFEVGGNTANNTATHFYTGAANTTLTDLVGIMNSGAGATAAGLSGAVLSGSQITLTAATVGTTISTSSTVVDQHSTAGTAYTGATAQDLVGSSSSGASVKTTVGLNANSDPIVATGADSLGGTLVLTNGAAGTAVTVTFGAGSNTNTGTAITLTAGNSNLTGLMNALNATTAGSASLTLGMTATMNATNTGLDFATTKTGTTMSVNAAGMTNISKMEFTNPTVAAVGIQASGSISLSDGGKITGTSATTAGAGTITGTVVITSGAVVDTFVMGSGAANTINGNTNTINIAGNTLDDLIAAIQNETGAGKLGGADLGVNAVRDAASGGIFVQSTVANVALSVNTAGLTDVMAEGKVDGSVGAPIVPTAIPQQVVFGTGSTNSATDVVSGHIVIKNAGGTNVNTTFTMGATAYNAANAAATGLGTNTLVVNGNTLADLARAINADSTGAYAGVAGVDLIATASDNKGLTVKAGTQTDVLSNYASTLQDQYSLSNGVVGNAGQAASAATFASASLGTGQKIGSGAELSGSIVLNNGGVNYTFNMASASTGSTATNINTSATTLAALADAISQSSIGLQASVDSNGVLQLQSTNSATAIAIVGTPTLKDTQAETFTGGVGGAGTPATPAAASQATVTLTGGGATALTGDILHGSITLTGASGSQTFQMGGVGAGSQTTGGTTAVGSDSTPFSETLGALAAAITADTALGITAQVTTHGLSLTMNTNVNTPVSAVNSLTDTSSAFSKASMTLGSFESQSDTLSGGTLSFSVGGQAKTVAIGPGTVSDMMATINGASNTDPYGVHASWDSASSKVVLTADAYGAAGNFTATNTNITDTTSGKSVAYVESAAYNVGISNSTSSTTALYDSSDQTNPTLNATNTPYTNFTTSAGSSSGTATISYSDGAGVSLSATDLSNQTDARVALSALNSAITAVAAQDGYIGAQINTLNSVSSVLSTQQQNVISAQNAVQATDYATAASNMSKYEILSQTGISALAQANSQQREVTKLLQ